MASSHHASSRKYIALSALALLFGLLIGVVIGYFAFSRGTETVTVPSCGDACQEPDPDIFNKLVNEMKASNIGDYLRKLTSVPHLAGTPMDLENAEYVRDEWIKYGLDSAKIYSYDVLLSYPDSNEHNLVQLLDEHGNINFTCAIEEQGLRDDEKVENIVNPFNAYSGTGNITGDLVYVNYARVEDFDELEEYYPDLNLTGKIFIARYGKIFRGNKALHSEQRGAIGLIIYSDPADYASDDATDVYPDAWWLPGTGAQRGNLHVSDHKGDPLTPGYPAKDYAYRSQVEDAPLPNIPVHPIGYDDAKMFLRELSGDIVPSGWAGDLGVTYRIGPGFNNANRKVNMDIHTRNEQRMTHNVIGFIEGAVEPDRYIILGNHRDAWVFGGVDPSSGTAGMMELTRAFGKLLKEGWRPRRSLVFGSWGAEEYGLIGSTEWVEEFVQNLAARTVAYLNVDIATSGDFTFVAKSTPLLYEAIYSATKKVTSPEDSSKSVYDVWLERYPPDSGDLPPISSLGSGSDFAPFTYRIGVPAADLRYRHNPGLGISSYPVYHSVYETYYLVEAFIDPEFNRNLAVTSVWGELARDLADSIIIPFNCKDYAEQIQLAVEDLKSKFESEMRNEGIHFDAVDSAAANFTSAATSFHQRIASMELNDAMKIRRINDQLMSVERAFIDPLGLPSRRFLRHVLFAPSVTNYYAGSAFPGIQDAMYKINENLDQWDTVKQQMAVIAFCIQSAASTMMDVVL
ncbi:N-acetylated-alpha-linked acidic dipeptidase 2-like [Saccoglossus kowalevskii]